MHHQATVLCIGDHSTASNINIWGAQAGLFSRISFHSTAIDVDIAAFNLIGCAGGIGSLVGFSVNITAIDNQITAILNTNTATILLAEAGIGNNVAAIDDQVCAPCSDNHITGGLVGPAAQGNGQVCIQSQGLAAQVLVCQITRSCAGGDNAGSLGPDIQAGIANALDLQIFLIMQAIVSLQLALATLNNDLQASARAGQQAGGSTGACAGRRCHSPLATPFFTVVVYNKVFQVQSGSCITGMPNQLGIVIGSISAIQSLGGVLTLYIFSNRTGSSFAGFGIGGFHIVGNTIVTGASLIDRIDGDVVSSYLKSNTINCHSIGSIQLGGCLAAHSFTTDRTVGNEAAGSAVRNSFTLGVTGCRDLHSLGPGVTVSTSICNVLGACFGTGGVLGNGLNAFYSAVVTGGQLEVSAYSILINSLAVLCGEHIVFTNIGGHSKGSCCIGEIQCLHSTLNLKAAAGHLNLLCKQAGTGEGSVITLDGCVDDLDITVTGNIKDSGAIHATNNYAIGIFGVLIPNTCTNAHNAIAFNGHISIINIEIIAAIATHDNGRLVSYALDIVLDCQITVFNGNRAITKGQHRAGTTGSGLCHIQGTTGDLKVNLIGTGNDSCAVVTTGNIQNCIVSALQVQISACSGRALGSIGTKVDEITASAAGCIRYENFVGTFVLHLQLTIVSTVYKRCVILIVSIPQGNGRNIIDNCERIVPIVLCSYCCRMI